MDQIIWDPSSPMVSAHCIPLLLIIILTKQINNQIDFYSMILSELILIGDPRGGLLILFSEWDYSSIFIFEMKYYIISHLSNSGYLNDI